MIELLSQIENGTIIRLKNSTGRDWVCIHYSCLTPEYRDWYRYNKHIKNNTGFFLFGGLWNEGDALTNKPYCKHYGMLERGMFNNIEIVGHIKKDYEKYLKGERL